MSSSGVFVIETSDWWGTCADTSTVRPVLDLLVQGLAPRPDILHCFATTDEELRHHLRRWRRTRRFPILYLAFHGAPGRLYLGNDRRRKSPSITFDDIAEMIGPSCRRRIIHFGACSVLAVDRRHVIEFLRRTGLVAATGFRRDLDWLTSSAFEVLILARMLRYTFSVAGARRMERAFERKSPYLRRELGFRVVVR